jgi:hypothetical protein
MNSMLSDQAADNAAKQFNSASKNQTDQFFADLSTNISKFNTEQKNAISQFNAGETNASAKFNAQIEAQRQQFNASNALVIAQANAQWRQNATTLDTAAQNTSNMEMAQTQNGLTVKALDEIWQKERDSLSYAFTSVESDQDRALELALANKKSADLKAAENSAEDAAKGAILTKLLFGGW